jgi:hypothetical protein
MNNWWTVILFLAARSGIMFGAEDDDWCVVTHPDHEKSATAQSGRAEAEKLFGLETAASATSSELTIPCARTTKKISPSGSRRGSRVLTSAAESKEKTDEKMLDGNQKCPLVPAHVIRSLRKLSQTNTSEQSDSDSEIVLVQHPVRAIPRDAEKQPRLLCAPIRVGSHAIVLRKVPYQNSELTCCEEVIAIFSEAFSWQQVVQWWEEVKKPLEQNGNGMRQKVHLL